MLEQKSAFINGKYYPSITQEEINALQPDSIPSSGSQGYERRRGYEDNAQDTVQPWDAMGKPNSEFLRLYPRQAAKVFDVDTIEQLKKKL